MLHAFTFINLELWSWTNASNLMNQTRQVGKPCSYTGWEPLPRSHCERHPQLFRGRQHQCTVHRILPWEPNQVPRPHEEQLPWAQPQEETAAHQDGLVGIRSLHERPVRPINRCLTQKSPFASFKGKSDFVTQLITESEGETIFKFLNKSLIAPVLRDQLLPFVSMTMQLMGGRMSQISEAAIPFPHRSGNLYNIQYLTRWFSTSDQDTRKHLDLMRNISNFMTPFVSSNPRAAYYGYKDIDLGRNKGVLPSYNEARVCGERYFNNNFVRLARVKRKGWHRELFQERAKYSAL